MKGFAVPMPGVQFLASKSHGCGEEKMNNTQKSFGKRGLAHEVLCSECPRPALLPTPPPGGGSAADRGKGRERPFLMKWPPSTRQRALDSPGPAVLFQPGRRLQGVDPVQGYRVSYGPEVPRQGVGPVATCHHPCPGSNRGIFWPSSGFAVQWPLVRQDRSQEIARRKVVKYSGIIIKKKTRNKPSKTITIYGVRVCQPT